MTTRHDLVRIGDRDSWICQLCWTPVARNGGHGRDRASLDHIIPRSLGGLTVDSNLRIAHQGCNNDRQSQIEEGRDVRRTHW